MKNVFLALFTISFLTNIAAQGENGELPGGEVEVVKTFEAQLAETERISIKPELPPTNNTPAQQNYANLPLRNLEVKYPAPSIRPLSMKREPLADAYDGYAKLGVGLPAAFAAEAGYGKRFGKKFDFAANANYLNMSNSSKVDNQKFNQLGVDTKGTYSLENGMAVRAKLGFESDVLHYYAYNELPAYADTVINSKEVKQRFNLFEIGGEFFNDQQTIADFNYSASIDFYRLTDLYAASEKGFDLTLKASKYFGGRHPLDIVLRTDFTAYESDEEQSLNNFYLEPSFTFVGDIFKVRGGLNIISHDDEYYFLPDIEALVNVLGPNLSAFVGIDGSLDKQDFRTLTEYNPFLKSRIDLTNNRWRDIYGGVKGAVSIFDYRAEVGYKTTDNLALFLPEFDLADRPYIQRFAPVYDTVNIVHIGGALTINPLKDLEVVTSINQNIYSLEKLEKPWHLPALELNAALVYTALEGQARVRADLFVENGVPFINEEGKADNLNGLLDISLGAEYFFSKQIGAFIQINNVANNRRQRWQNYPTLGINALVGVSAKF